MENLWNEFAPSFIADESDGINCSTSGAYLVVITADLDFIYIQFDCVTESVDLSAIGMTLNYQNYSIHDTS